jgi:hypothetical protein
MMVAQRGAELGLKLWRQLLAYEEAVDFPGDEVGGGGLLQDDIDNVGAIKIAGLAEKGFFGVVVLVMVDDELCVDAIQPVKARAASRMSFSL